MKILRVLVVIAGMIALFLLAAGLFKPHHEELHIFANLAGPHDKSIVPVMAETSWKQYAGGSDSRVSILLTNEKSNWLGLAHGFKSIGLPFSVTTDYHEAIRHKVVIVYPLLSGSTLKPEALQNLADFTRKGGTLIAFAVVGGGMGDIFGFDKAEILQARYHLKFNNPPSDADPLEKEIPIDNPNADIKNAMGAYVYNAARKDVAAVYEDGKAAITDRKIGNGRAVAFGFDLGALLLKGYNNRQESMARSYDNGYEPALDVLLRFIATIYRQSDDRAVMLAPVPEGQKLAVILTHDIDYTRSLANAVDYAKFEHDAGVRATYFMQTKYIRDYNDDVILTSDSPDYLNQLQQLGMEIGSHTVSHAYMFRKFPIGDGTESYPDYRPFVHDRMTATGGSILGELRVSRFLIEQLVPHIKVSSFRPGYLSDPYSLPQAMMATDYRFSSSVTANDSLTHLPFQLTYSRESTAEVPIYEFPITIADGPPLFADRLNEGIDLAKKIARKGGLCVVLIHPDVVEPKFGFEQKFVAAVKDFSWFGTIEEFGQWWEARDGIQIDSEWKNEKLLLHIRAAKAINGLTLIVPDSLHPLANQNSIKTADGGKIVLKAFEGNIDIALTRANAAIAD